MNFLLNLDYQQSMIYFPITRPCYYPSLRKSANRKFIVTQDGIISDSIKKSLQNKIHLKQTAVTFNNLQVMEKIYEKKVKIYNEKINGEYRRLNFPRTTPLTGRTKSLQFQL